MTPTAGQAATVRIVVVDDERPLTALVTRYLEREGYEVHVAYDGPTALDVIAEVDPDVVVLDLMLPGIDGLEVARRIREHADPYVVMLTARTDEVDRIVGLRVGADDYVTKPFSPNELVARIQAMLRRPRRPAPPTDRVRTFGDLRIDPEAREVTRGDTPVELTRLEFDLLDVLSGQPRRVFSKELLLDEVWGSASYRDDHVVAVHIANLRRKLGDSGEEPRYIRTVRGVGYRMVDR
ncbi:MAG TPA: response regulator transcription factor [Egicoccus sp.]|nr:response regulator transcription factor [Egicoccus sp.]HSK24403.1 response regulator transcription factor [Egicoccus sp.]